MKLLIVLICLLGLQAQANTLIFRDGRCTGGGVLNPKMMFVPNLNFSSQRTLSNGTIRASSTVNILGFKTIVHANLLFETTGTDKINVRDLDTVVNGVHPVVGTASCGPSACFFDAKVMNGQLFLSETLMPTADGIAIRNGFQIYQGTQGTYTGNLSCQ